MEDNSCYRAFYDWTGICEWACSYKICRKKTWDVRVGFAKKRYQRGTIDRAELLKDLQEFVDAEDVREHLTPQEGFDHFVRSLVANKRPRHPMMQYFIDNRAYNTWEWTRARTIRRRDRQMYLKGYNYDSEKNTSALTWTRYNDVS